MTTEYGMIARNEKEFCFDYYTPPSTQQQLISGLQTFTNMGWFQAVLSLNDQSAGKKKSVRISRAGVYIKPLLVQCANAAIKDKKFLHYRNRYEALKHRRGHKRAIIAIARMMLTALYHMLSTGELFNPALYEKSQRKPGFVASSEEHAVKLLQRLGYSVVKQTVPA